MIALLISIFWKRVDNLFNMVKDLAGDAVVNNPKVPNNHNNEVIAEATKTFAGGLSSGIMDMNKGFMK